jgi:4-hydroxy-3-methylbut-2-enyl diphosphate reductase
MPDDAPAPAPFEDRYFRSGLGTRREARAEVSSEWRSDWAQAFRDNDFTLRVGDTTLLLAREFGFCYGVERSVDYAYETVRRFPDRRIILTGEIVHNPRINGRLREMGVCFFGDDGLPDAGAVEASDVVILPAFGVATGQFDGVRESGAVVVDTTCGSVLNVWKNVERYARDGLTSLVHGKVNHEETVATVSQTSRHEGGHFIVVLDMAEAEIVADYIREGGDADAFRARFPPPHTSRGFDPDRHLQRIGVANQTTMLAGESLAIAKVVGEALQARYGDAEDRARFRSFDTICSATQERQDALRDLLAEPLDLLIAIGGYNSSNTGHLAEMAEGIVPAYHVTGPECLDSADRIRHKPAGKPDEAVARGWLRSEGPLTIGLTAGASTPDALVGLVVDRLLALRGHAPQAAPEPSRG